jgi:DNA-directed RNA polymerase specialized sigma24 family protein
MTDQELLDGIRRHDPTAVEAVYRLCRPGIISYVKQNSGSYDEAMDIIQDAMLASYMNITKPGFILTSALSTYIQGIGRLVWLKHIERHKKRYIPESKLKRSDNHS